MTGWFKDNSKNNKYINNNNNNHSNSFPRKRVCSRWWIWVPWCWDVAGPLVSPTLGLNPGWNCLVLRNGGRGYRDYYRGPSGTIIGIHSPIP